MKSARLVFVCLFLLPLLLGCGNAQKPRDPVGVIQEEIKAINNAHADSAAGYFSDEGQIVCAWGQPKGKDKVKSFIATTLIKMKSHAELVDLMADGVNVTGTIVWSNPYEKFPPFALKAIVQDGKISRIEWGTSSK